MTNREKDILALFNELNSMLYEVLDDCNKALAMNAELLKDVEWYKRYTDSLIEHKDMACLPADLRNLREANAALATENEELKKKVKELTRPEPTEEELNSLFMDKQVDPKDIEFEAEKLVKSVQDYADSIQNKNESNLKYFNATTGKWNNAELMKQDPEILALKDPEPKLKSLKQHNDSKLTNVFGVNSTNSGFACPICTSELIYTNPNLMLTSHPPKREVRCSNCNHIDYVY